MKKRRTGNVSKRDYVVTGLDLSSGMLARMDPAHLDLLNEDAS